MIEFNYKNSDELCEQMSQAMNSTTFLAFSCGKDAIGAWIQLRKYFKTIIPVYMDPFPWLSFHEEYLKYFEDKFGVKVHRLVHGMFFSYLEDAEWSAPEDVKLIMNWEKNDQILKEFQTDEWYELLREEFNLPNIYQANGVKACDSIYRGLSIKTHGAINHNKKKFLPVYDWSNQRLFDEIQSAGIKLPKDYLIWGRTFDGYDYKFSKGLKDHFPDEYKRLIDMFPMVEADHFRWEHLEWGK